MKVSPTLVVVRAGDAEHVDRDARVRRGVPGPGGHGLRAAQVVTSRGQAQACNVGEVSKIYLVYRALSTRLQRILQSPENALNRVISLLKAPTSAFHISQYAKHGIK